MSHRERDEDYDRVIVRLGPDWRVIECADAFQWIVQRRLPSQWWSKKYCTSRDGLIRRCGPGLGNVAFDGKHPHPGLPGWEALKALPERFVVGADILCPDCQDAVRQPLGG